MTPCRCYGPPTIGPGTFWETAYESKGKCVKKYMRRIAAGIAIGSLAASGLVIAPSVNAAESAKCPRTTEAQNLKTAVSWIRSINQQDWTTFEKLTHNDRNIHLSTGAAPAPGNQDDIAAWQHMHRIFKDMKLQVSAYATHENSLAQASHPLPGAGKNTVAFIGDIVGTLPDGTAAKVPYTAWLFIRCGQIHNEYGMIDPSPEVLSVMATTP